MREIEKFLQILALKLMNFHLISAPNFNSDLFQHSYLNKECKLRKSRNLLSFSNRKSATQAVLREYQIILHCFFL